MNFKSKQIMLVVAHPDDELLGLGATMHKLIHDQPTEIPNFGKKN
jgi:LmbE family N-acetylglucosaminyl deacetylase